MATKGERQALLFLAAAALLGAGTRACRARNTPVPMTDLDRQIAAVEGPGQHRPAERRRPAGKVESRPSDPAPVEQAARIDVDLATSADIERLPGVGPALAKRIVANRETAGAFGCLAALDPVKGIGPSLLRRLDSLVTFSGAPRAACAQR
jgi:competence protein ComEA